MAISGIDKLYQERTDFTIVALTGYTATGCSYLAEIMQDAKFYKRTRKPEDIKLEVPKSTDNNNCLTEKEQLQVRNSLATQIFKRKYTICYDYIKENYEPFVKISYTRVLWLVVLLKAIEDGCNYKQFRDKIISIISDKFNCGRRDGEYRNDYKIDELKDKIKDELSQWEEWEALHKELSLASAIEDEVSQNHELAKILIFNKESVTNQFLTFIR